ncbi:MAG: CDP-diacylglycerol--serine O-phosphatidyltransferase [Myxococcales bacterium]|nr:CDP-diacylglycerol--serine O-phosphatidyltransferase [Myxococcales bacterium]
MLTLSSVFCGFYATVLAANAEQTDSLYRASVFIVLAMLLDTIDGRVARLTRTQSALGVQLDSLADVISFGVAPAFLVYRWSLEDLGSVGLIAVFSFVAAGVVRLARFNVLAMTPSGAVGRPSKYTVGLPIPAAAGILVSLVAASHAANIWLPSSPVFVLVLVVSLALFMVSTIRFRSFKDLKLSWQTALLLTLAVAPGIALGVYFHISVTLIWLLSAHIIIGLGESVLRISRRTWASSTSSRRQRQEPLQ